MTVDARGGETFLTYLLHSSSGIRGGFHYHLIRGRPIKSRPHDYHVALLEKIERLQSGEHVDGSLVLGEEVPIDLAARSGSGDRHRRRTLGLPDEAMHKLRAAYRIEYTQTTLQMLGLAAKIKEWALEVQDNTEAVVDAVLRRGE